MLEWLEIEARARDPHWPDISTVRATFGTWANFIRALNETPRVIGQRTRRRQKPSSLLVTLAQRVRDVYLARDAEDVSAMRRALQALSAEALRLDHSLTDAGTEEEARLDVAPRS